MFLRWVWIWSPKMVWWNRLPRRMSKYYTGFEKIVQFMNSYIIGWLLKFKPAECFNVEYRTDI